MPSFAADLCRPLPAIRRAVGQVNDSWTAACPTSATTASTTLPQSTVQRTPRPYLPCCQTIRLQMCSQTARSGCARFHQRARFHCRAETTRFRSSERYGSPAGCRVCKQGLHKKKSRHRHRACHCRPAHPVAERGPVASIPFRGPVGGGPGLRHRAFEHTLRNLPPA